MEWFENNEIAEIAQTIVRFNKNEITGKVVDLEHLGKPKFPKEALGHLAEMGFLWGVANEETGGINMSPITTVVVLSKLAEASAGFAAIVAAHYAAVQSIQLVPGGDDFLKTIGTDSLIGISLNNDVEILKDHSSDSSPTGQSINFIPAPQQTAYTIVFDKAGTDFQMYIVKRGDFDNCVKKEICLSGCDEIPLVRIFSGEDFLKKLKPISEGKYAENAYHYLLSLMKLYLSAIMQGSARSATVSALKYTTERFQTGKIIIEHQNVRKKIIDMEIKNQAMASFVYRAAHNQFNHTGFDLCDMLFAFTGAEAEYVCNEAIQSLGGYGYMKEYGLEKKLRDIKTLQAFMSCSLMDWLGLKHSR
ncbi:MAG TPA: acyl-CoA dehydrogenase family protein [Smithella sp.]|nr:acyl-CoA dehydrogenase family protein [Smithella sp.]